MSTEERHAMHQRALEESWNLKNLAAIDELWSADFKHHTRSQGREDVKQEIAVFHAAFSDTHSTIEDVFSSGDKTVTRWTLRGTHTGELMGVPPTGKQVVIQGIFIALHANGKVVEGWGIFDQLGLLQQIGAIPTPTPGQVVFFNDPSPKR